MMESLRDLTSSELEDIFLKNEKDQEILKNLVRELEYRKSSKHVRQNSIEKRRIMILLSRIYATKTKDRPEKSSKQSLMAIGNRPALESAKKPQRKRKKKIQLALRHARFSEAPKTTKHHASISTPLASAYIKSYRRAGAVTTIIQEIKSPTLPEMVRNDSVKTMDMTNASPITVPAPNQTDAISPQKTTHHNTEIIPKDVYLQSNPAMAVSMIDSKSFMDDHYTETLDDMINHVIEHEGPVSGGIILWRIARAHGWTCPFTRMRNRLWRLLWHDYRQYRTHEGSGYFYWPTHLDRAEHPPFRPPGNQDSIRRPKHICLPELTSLAHEIISMGLYGDDALHAMSHKLGLEVFHPADRPRLKKALVAAMEWATQHESLQKKRVERRNYAIQPETSPEEKVDVLDSPTFPIFATYPDSHPENVLDDSLLDNACKVLRVAPGAAWERVELARRHLVQQASPARMAAMSPENKQRLQEQAQSANLAAMSIWKSRMSQIE